jgi:DNA polymerase-3 subunit delta'
LPFEDIDGQERAVELLSAELAAGWVPHAHLFVGPGGVGRVKMARELAAVLLCPEQEGDRCGECRNCHAFQTGNHPDYFEIGVPEGRQSLPISLIRGGEKGERGVQDEAGLKPVLADQRVFVVRDAERMTMEAANCFLKTLEEPPGECYFILIASGLREIPDTIVSRCRLIKLSGLPAPEVEQQLRAQGIDGDDAWWLARRCWGSPGRAREFNLREMPAINRKVIKALLRIGPRDNFQMTDWVQKLADDQAGSSAERRDALQDLLECIAVFYRDLAVLRLEVDVEVFNHDMREPLEEFAARFALDEIIESADRAMEALENVGKNANQRLVLDDLFSNLPIMPGRPR